MEIQCKKTLVKRKLVKGDDKYDKISHKQKILMIKRAIYDRCGIKKASDQLNLNYSTAKTLIRRFKTRGYKLNKEFIIGCSQWFDIYALQQQMKRCTYLCINQPDKAKNRQKKSRSKNCSTFENSQEAASQLTNQSRARPTGITIIQQVLFKE